MRIGGSKNSIENGQNSDELISEINVTPLIDVMMVLLILFMVTSSISFESGLDVDLPKTTHGKEMKERENLIVSINKEQEIFVKGEKITENQLEQRLKELVKEKTIDTLIFQGDKNTTIEKTIQILDIARGVGIKSISIAALPAK